MFVKEKQSAEWFTTNAKSHLNKGIYLLISILFSLAIIFHS
jgi:maltose/moltooligosaccharide transporter